MLVGSCVCMAEVRMRVYNMFVPSTSVHLQRKTRSSPTPKVCVSSIKCVRLQCDIVSRSQTLRTAKGLAT